MKGPEESSFRPLGGRLSEPDPPWTGGERALAAGVCLLSLSAVGYEVLLLRLFSIVQWYHFASLILSLALLGYGAAGTFLSLAQRRLLPRAPTFLPAAAAGFGLTALAGFGLAQRVEFNPLEIVWDSGQLINFLLVYLILAVPFFFAALGIGIVLAARKDRISRIYRADLVGGAAGAAGVIALLFLFRPSGAARWLGGGGLAAAALFYAAAGGTARKTAAAAVAAVLLALAWPGRWLVLELSPYKDLSRSLDIPGAEIVSERHGPSELLAALRSPEIPFRHAPGLSLAYRGRVPEQIAIFSDGDFAGVITAALRRDDREIFRYRISAAPYSLVEVGRVLVLNAGGGEEVLSALVHGADQVVAVELNPRHMDLVREFDDFSSGLYDDERVRVAISEARIFIETTGDRYDLVQLAAASGFGAAAHSLREDFLFTVNSFRTVFSRLKPEGALAVTMPLNLPPRDSLKIIATIAEAWRREGADPAASLAVVRGWDTVTVMARRTPLGETGLAALVDFADSRFFDLDYFPGISPDRADRFHRLDPPWLRQGAAALLGPGRDGFIRDYKFAIAPPTDDRPFFFRFFRWATLPELLEARERGGAFLLEWGYLLLLFALAQALVAGTVFILLPLAATRSRRAFGRHKSSTVAYFSALGLAFLFVEIAFIQKFILYLGHPVYAASLTVASFMLFAGLGSGFSGRFSPAAREGKGGVPVRLFPFAAGVTLLAYYFFLPTVIDRTLGVPVPVKVPLAVALIAPPAFLMGMPFPMGLKRLARGSPGGIPWAWGINGFASVVSALAANLAAIHLGISAVIGLGAGLYLLAAAAARRW